jgi:hypothetical protein
MINSNDDTTLEKKVNNNCVPIKFDDKKDPWQVQWERAQEIIGKRNKLSIYSEKKVENVYRSVNEANYEINNKSYNLVKRVNDVLEDINFKNKGKLSKLIHLIKNRKFSYEIKVNPDDFESEIIEFENSIDAFDKTYIKSQRMNLEKKKNMRDKGYKHSIKLIENFDNLKSDCNAFDYIEAEIEKIKLDENYKITLDNQKDYFDLLNKKDLIYQDLTEQFSCVKSNFKSFENIKKRINIIENQEHYDRFFKDAMMGKYNDLISGVRDLVSDIQRGNYLEEGANLYKKIHNLQTKISNFNTEILKSDKEFLDFYNKEQEKRYKTEEYKDKKMQEISSCINENKIPAVSQKEFLSLL